MAQDLFGYIKQKALNAANTVGSFVTQNPTPNAFIAGQFNQRVAQPIQQEVQRNVVQPFQRMQQPQPQPQPDIQSIFSSILERARNTPISPMGVTYNNAPTYKAPLEEITAKVPEQIKVGVPALKIPEIVGSTIRNYGELAHGQVTPENAIQAGLDILPVAGSLKAVKPELRAALKEAKPEIKTAVKTIDEMVQGKNAIRLPRRPAGSMITTPEGVTIAPNVQPKTTQGLDFILQKAKEVLNNGEINKEIPKPEVPAQLGAPSAIAGLLPAKGGTTPVKDPLMDAIKASGSFGKTVNKVKELVLEPKRFLEKVLPDEVFAPVKKEVFDRLNVLRGQAADLKNLYSARVVALGKEFARGSKYSEYTQKLGEGVITPEQLNAQIGEAGTQKVMNAVNTFRQMYDEILGTINKNRVAEGLEPIAKRQDYFRHMMEMGSTGDSWLSTLMSGGSGAKSASIMKARKGEKTVYDAVGGFVDYLDKAGRAGFTDLVAPTIKKISTALKDAGANQQTTKYLDEYADQILGIQKDEGAVVNALNAVGGKMRAAKVLGNPSSVLSQPLNVAIGANDAGWGKYIKGFVDKEANKAVEMSAYIKDRAQRTPLALEQGWGKVKSTLGAVLQEADVTSTKTIWKGFYEKAKALGEANPIQYADDATEAVVGSRGIGGFAKGQTSKLGQLLAPFTVEPQAGANRIIELIGEKRAGTLIGIAITDYLVNNVYEGVGPGYRPLIDPIEAITEAYKLATGSDEKDSNKVQAAARLAVEALQLMPMAQAPLATGYKIGESLGVLPDSKEVFGTEDPTRFNTADMYSPFSNMDRNVTGNKVVDYPLNIAGKFIPGVNPLAKGIQGTRMANQGYAESKKGNVMFETPQDPVSRVRQALFGPWSTKEARAYFSGDTNKTLTAKESDVYKNLPQGQRTTFIDTTQKGRVASAGLDRALEKGTTVKSLPAGTSFKTANEYVSKALTGGATPSVEDLKLGYFNKKTAKSPLVSERNDVFKKIGTAFRSEVYTDEQKQAILEASGASKDEAEYYLNATKDKDVKIQEMLPKLDNMSNEELLTYLTSGRKAVGGSQLITSEIITYLYDNNIIGKDEKDMLNALKFDEGNGKFYFSRGFSDGGSGAGKKLTYAQAKSIFNVKIPSFSSMQKGISSLSQQTSTSGVKLISDIVGRKTKKATIKFKK